MFNNATDIDYFITNVDEVIAVPAVRRRENLDPSIVTAQSEHSF